MFTMAFIYISVYSVPFC